MTIPGLQYVSDYLSLVDHDSLLRAVDSHRWLASVDHGVQIYGFGYSRAGETAIRVGDLPAWADGVGARLCRDGFLPDRPNQLVANNYEPGAGIFAHVDQAVFGEVVASISLGSACVMQFVHRETLRAEEILLEPRSLLVLSGEARVMWTHGIPARASDVWGGEDRRRGRRVSLTFRVVPA